MDASVELQPPAVLLATTSFCEWYRRVLGSEGGFWEGQGFGEKVFFLPLTSSRSCGGTGLKAAAHAMSSSILTICLCQ